MSEQAYVTSPIKRRRAGRDEMDARNQALLHIVSVMQPMTVRQVFYQATVRDVVPKDEAGYRQVQRALVDLRRSGLMPWHWIADNTRWQSKPTSWRTPSDALNATAQLYRKALWQDAAASVEVWIEKDALSSVVFPITSAFDVPLMVARGYSSLSFLYEVAEDIKAQARPTFIYHLGDFDPSGVDAANKIDRTLREFAPDAEIHFERLAVLPAQIDEWNLPARPTKQTDSRARGFGARSVELDAIDPHRLRAMVRDAIERHLPQQQYQVLKTAEASERQLMRTWAEVLGDAA